MQKETAKYVKIVLTTIACVVIFLGVCFFVLKNIEAPIFDSQIENIPSKDGDSSKVQDDSSNEQAYDSNSSNQGTTAPIVVSEELQADFKQIQDQANSGEITNEEAQNEFNELAKKMPPPPLPPEARVNTQN